MPGEKDMAASLAEAARRLRIRAEEYRITAEVAVSESVRTTYLHLARTYEALAQRAEKSRRGNNDGVDAAPLNSGADADHARIHSWRIRARELRTIAEEMKDPSACLGMLNAAESYEGLADDAEARRGRKVAR